MVTASLWSSWNAKWTNSLAFSCKYLYVLWFFLAFLLIILWQFRIFMIFMTVWLPLRVIHSRKVIVSFTLMKFDRHRYKFWVGPHSTWTRFTDQYGVWVVLNYIFCQGRHLSHKEGSIVQEFLRREFYPFKNLWEHINGSLFRLSYLICNFQQIKFGS